MLAFLLPDSGGPHYPLGSDGSDGDGPKGQRAEDLGWLTVS